MTQVTTTATPVSIYERFAPQIATGSRAIHAWILFFLSLPLYYIIDWGNSSNGLDIAIIGRNVEWLLK